MITTRSHPFCVTAFGHNRPAIVGNGIRGKPYRLWIVLLGTFLLLNGMGLSSVYADPFAEDDAETTAFEESIGIDVLFNDEEDLYPLDPMTVTVVSDPTNGMAVVDPGSGLVEYFPDEYF